MQPAKTHPFRTSVAVEHEKFKNRNRFNPDKEFVSQAVQDFLDSGGKIKKVEDFVSTETKYSRRDADKWLRGSEIISRDYLN